MLSEYDQELLTAFVDGEMTRRQRKSALRLLHESSEARSLLRDLQENAHALKLLPPRKLETDFASQVVREITARGLKPQPPIAPVRSAWRRWAPVASAAAAILVAVGVFFATRPGDDDSPVVKGPDDDKLVVPAPRKLALVFADLNDTAKRDELRKELDKEPSAHVDLAVKDSSKAIERMTQVFRDKKVELVVSKTAQASLGKKESKAQFVVYAEGLKADDVAAILQQLSVDGKKALPGNFQALTVTAYSQDDSQKLSTLLGVMLAQNPSDGAAKKSAAPPIKSDRFALVLADAGEPGQGLSPDMQAFLASRRDAAPGAMRVVFVVHVA